MVIIGETSPGLVRPCDARAQWYHAFQSRSPRAATALLSSTSSTSHHCDTCTQHCCVSARSTFTDIKKQYSMHRTPATPLTSAQTPPTRASRPRRTPRALLLPQRRWPCCKRIGKRHHHSIMPSPSSTCMRSARAMRTFPAPLSRQASHPPPLKLGQPPRMPQVQPHC